MKKVAMIVLVLGILLIIGYTAVQVVSNLLFLPGIPTVIKIALGLIIVSVLVILLSLIWERLKGGDDEDVHRKY